MAETTLRARSRARRRAAIERAALTLFAERGYEATTIADIAAAAEVAPRTVSLYFPTKLDLALAYSNAAARRMMALLADSGDDEPLVEALVRFVRHELLEESGMLARHRAMTETNLQLRGVRSAIGAESYLQAKIKLARELGRDLDDVAVGIVGAAAEGVVRSLLELDPAGNDVGVAVEIAVAVLEASMTVVRSGEFVG